MPVKTLYNITVDLKQINGIDIIKKIAASGGNCDWTTPSVCKRCPFSQLKKKLDGSAVNCVEAIGAQDLTEKDVDARFKVAAENFLLETAIEEILGVKDESK
jgi:hypothetical protein